MSAGPDKTITRGAHKCHPRHKHKTRGALAFEEYNCHQERERSTGGLLETGGAEYFHFSMTGGALEYQ